MNAYLRTALRIVSVVIALFLVIELSPLIVTGCQGEFTRTRGGMTYCTPESASGKTECVIFDFRSSDARRAECEADPSCVWIGTLEPGETIVIDPFSRREPEPNPIEQREL